MNGRRRPKFHTLAGLAVLALILLIAGDPPVVSGPNDSAPPAAAIHAATTPEAARDFSLTTLDGGSLALSELRGQWVLLNFWATWCPPCREEMPYLNQVANEREMVVLGINFNEDHATVEQFVRDHQLTFPMLLNPDDITLLVYGVRGLPRSFVIAPDGAIAATIVGAIDPGQFDAWLDAQGIARKR
jgi:thiol-disulfide isomerase/thioredoxin